MSSVYTPTAVALGNITIPSDGDARNAASVNVPLQAIADGVKYLGSTVADISALSAITTPTDGTVRHVIGFGWYVFKTAVTTGLYPFVVQPVDFTPGRWVASACHQTTLTRQCPVSTRLRGITNGGSGSAPATITPTTTDLSFVPVIGADGTFARAAFGPFRAFTGATQNYGYLVDLHAEMVDGATLASATLRFAASGHVGLPTRQPQFAIIRSTYATGTGTLTNLLSTGNGYVTLAAASQPAYDALQALVFTPNQNNVIDKTLYQYAAIIIDEAGTNAGAGGLGSLGCSYQSIELSFTIPDDRRS